MEWTEYDKRVLVKAIKDGLSATATVALLEGCYTRNALIGKAHRMGLAFSSTGSNIVRAKTSSKARPSQARKRPSRPSATVLAAKKENAPTALPELSREQREAIAKKLGKLYCGPASVLDRQAHQCKWPIGDPRSKDFRVCGRLRSEWGERSTDDTASPYCAEHHSIAFAGAPARRVRA